MTEKRAYSGLAFIMGGLMVWLSGGIFATVDTDPLKDYRTATLVSIGLLFLGLGVQWFAARDRKE